MMATILGLRQRGVAPCLPLTGAKRFKVMLIRFHVGVHAAVLRRQKRVGPTGRGDQCDFPRTAGKGARRCGADLKTTPRLRSGRIFFPLEQALSLGWRRRYALTPCKMAPVGVYRKRHQRIRKSVAIPIKVKYGIGERMP